MCVALTLSSAHAARATPAVGDALEFGSTDPNYLDKNWQVVGVIPPYSASRRLYDSKEGVFVGPNRRKGVVWWVKKREWNPFSRQKRPPFKVRLFKPDPRGAFLTLVEEGKVDLSMEEVGGEVGLSVKLARPRPWWRPFG